MAKKNSRLQQGLCLLGFPLQRPATALAWFHYAHSSDPKPLFAGWFLGRRSPRTARHIPNLRWAEWKREKFRRTHNSGPSVEGGKWLKDRLFLGRQWPFYFRSRKTNPMEPLGPNMEAGGRWLVRVSGGEGTCGCFASKEPCSPRPLSAWSVYDAEHLVAKNDVDVAVAVAARVGVHSHRLATFNFQLYCHCQLAAQRLPPCLPTFLPSYLQQPILSVGSSRLRRVLVI